MNYRIVGNDGKIYGPVGAEQIRAWIAQRRVESRTPVFVDGAAEWSFVGILPEFAAHFSATPPPASSSPPLALPPPNHALAIWSFVCGLLSWVCCCCCCNPFHVLGLVLGIIALVQIQALPEPRPGRGLAIAGIVLSATNLLWCIVLGVINAATSPSNFSMKFN
jgi:hypothetical protein